MFGFRWTADWTSTELVPATGPLGSIQLEGRHTRIPDAILRVGSASRPLILPREEAAGRVTHGLPVPTERDWAQGEDQD